MNDRDAQRIVRARALAWDALAAQEQDRWLHLADKAFAELEESASRLAVPPSADETAASCHPGHRRYFGGSMDGQVHHLVYTTPSDYPQTIGTLLRDGQRSWYVLDYDASQGTEAVYRFVGLGRTWEEAAS